MSSVSRFLISMKSLTLCIAVGIVTGIAPWILCSANAADPASSSSGQASRVLVIAHRGAHAEVPENTLAAFRKAIEIGCDFVEMDIRNTKDGVLIILHDSTLDRTTNGSGHVGDWPLSSVRRLAIKDLHGKGLSSEKVPTFDEALGVCQGKIKVYVDYKCGKPADVIATIEKHQMLKDVVVYGGTDSLREFKRLRPELLVMTEHPSKPEEIASLATELKPMCFDGHHLKWSQAQVGDAHRAGAQVWVDMLGPFDNVAGYTWVAKMGVDAIQTNCPESLIQWRQRDARP
jgi:glycerophosphoryl diester phosphodiesterase